MYPRTEYEMSEEDLVKILIACNATPVLFFSGGITTGKICAMPIGGTQQENANRAWEKLGKKMGFDYLTLRPIEGKCQRFFTAIPSETKSQRQEREKKKAHENKVKIINQLNKEISDREKEIKDLNLVVKCWKTIFKDFPDEN